MDESKQERLLNLLLSGKTISETAQELDISRTTIYETLKLPEVQARHNQLLQDIKTDTKNGLFSLYSQATNAIRICVNSANLQLRFKAAVYLLERLDKLRVKSTDVEEIRQQEEADQRQAERLESLFQDLQY